MNCQTSDFNYPLPARLIAQHPPRQRGDSRLLTLSRPGGTLGDHAFSSLPELLRAGDLLVLNDTRVIPARFFCRRETGGRIEGLFLREHSRGRWEVLLRNAQRCKTGQRLTFERSDPVVALGLEARGEAGRWIVTLDQPQDAVELLQRVGKPPLPPYIRRDQNQIDPDDSTRYQTIYAAQPGAVAAPTAGLHFTPEILEALASAGVQTTFVTLHVGPGTFAPVKAGAPEDHVMHSEWYELSAAAAERIASARESGQRIVAVGTTSVRVLETVAAEGNIQAASGWTDIFLYPPAGFRAVDALITNFHLPCSTLVMLVAAFCDPGGTGGIEMIRNAYAHAIAQEYRFYSYGDAMLIE